MSGFNSVYNNVSFMSDWQKERSPEKIAQYRDEINKDELISRCEEVSVESLHDPTKFDKNDFLIARIFWDRNEKKYHDHWAFLDKRTKNGIDVVYISDISKVGEKPKNVSWSFEDIESNISTQKLQLFRLYLSDIQDDDMVIERAKEYVVPNNFRPMKFAYFGISGLKEPVFSEHQLALCNSQTLLLLRNDEVVIPILLHRVDKTSFFVSFKGNDDDIKEMSFNQILNLITSDRRKLQFYPGIKIKSLTIDTEEKKTKAASLTNDTIQHPTDDKNRSITSETIQASTEVTAVHAFEHSFEHALLQTVQHTSAHLGIEILSKTGGGAIHGLIKSAFAVKETRKARKMENLSKQTEGLVGFSRTKANRKITKAWTEAAAGTSGSLGVGLIGAGVGQLVIPVPGVGAAVGGIVGGIIGSIAAGSVAKKVSGKIFDNNILEKCPLCLYSDVLWRSYLQLDY